MADKMEVEAPQDIRPIVARPRGNASVWIFAGILTAVAGGIFYSLQMNRVEMKGDALVAQTEVAGTIASPPALVIPPALLEATQDALQQEPSVSALVQQSAQPQSIMSYRPAYAAAEPPANYYPPAPSPGPSSEPERDRSGGVIFQTPISTPTGPQAGEQSDAKNAGVARVRSAKLQDPGVTVPQGSVIQAVMETALDSTRAGFARAIVSRDVMSFDGTKVLVPRGSKLVGEYKADVSLGQKRALVQWHRLTLPDGTIIDVDSPAADPLGRAGVKGKVSTHFFERFSGAILQSVLDIGVRAATSEATNNTVIIGTPTTTQTSLTNQQNSIQPTLKVRQGASITVFVARDLVFS